MNHPVIALGVCGTFGSPNGFQQCFYQPTLFSRSLDLDSKALEVAAGEPLFMVRRDGSTNTICVAAYSYAREPQSSRRGTFIGSAVALPAGNFSAQALSDLIEELHSDVVSAPQNMVDGVLQVSEAIALTVAEPHALKSAEASFERGKRSSIEVADGQVALISGKRGNLVQFLQWAFPYFPHFDTLYFTANAQTQRSAAQKGLVPILQWQQFEEEKAAVVAAEKAAAQRAGAAKRKGAKSAGAAKEHNLFEPWDAGAQWSRSEREQRVEEHNNLLHLYQSMAEQFQKNYLSEENAPTAKKPRPKRRLNYYKMAFFALLLAGIFAGSYWLYAGSRKQKTEAANTLAIREKEVRESQPLEPVPNADLDSASRAALFPQGFRGWSADSITAQLYAGKPELTHASWPKMQARYRNALVAANPTCFVGSGGAFWCICDSLKVLPVFAE